MTDVRMKGFFEKTPVDETLKIILKRINPLPSEKIKITDAPGRVLASVVKASMDIPPFNRSAMDGYAVRGEDTFGATQTNPISFKVIGEVLPGSSFDKRIGEFTAAKIMTGGRVPEGADAVVMLEYTSGRSEIEVIKAVSPGKNVSLQGEDFKKGDVALEGGRVLTAQDVGILAALGVGELEVGRRPSVGIISSGDEVAAPGEKIKEGEIYDINGHVLSSLARHAGGLPEFLGIIKDDYEALKNAIKNSLDFDVIVLSGATSVGEKDVIPAIARELGEVLVHGVSMRPGAPTGFGIINDRPVFMLPGHPAATIFGFEVFVRPALQKMQGAEPYNPYPTIEGVLKKKIASELGRRDFVWVKVDEKGSVDPIRTSSSGIVSRLLLANGFVVVPENTEGLREGKKVEVSMFRNL